MLKLRQPVSITFMKVITIMIGVFLGFFFSELAIRIVSPQMTGPVQFAYDPELGEIPVPNRHGRRTLPGNYDYTYSNNSLGFRGNREYDYEKLGKYRILLLGDSFSYGVGVNDDEVVAYYLEKNLSLYYGSTEIINASNGGKGTDYALKLFQTLGYKFKPDLTVVCFFFNDFADNERSEYFTVDNDGKLTPKRLPGSFGARKTFLMGIPGYSWLISWSHAANLIKNSVSTYIKSRVAKNSDFIKQYPETDQLSNAENMRLTKIYTSKLNEIIKANGSEFIIFYFPSGRDIVSFRSNESFSNDEQAITRITKDNNIRFCSLTALLARSECSLDELYYKEGHWKAKAHFIGAQSMSEEIKHYMQRRVGK